MDAVESGLPRARSKTQRDNPRESSLFVSSFEKGLLVLMAFDRTRSSLGMRDIMALTKLDQSTVQRFTHTLHTLGFLRKDPVTKRFALSPKVLQLGFAYLHTNSLVEYVTPTLYNLNAKLKECVNLTEMLGSDIVYVARVPGHHTISVDILLGTRMPAYAAAPGRAMLAHMTKAEVNTVLDGSDLRKLTPKTITNRGKILSILREVAELGYALAVDQCYEGDLSAAAPIFDSSGRVIAAINVSVPTARWDVEAARRRLVPEVMATAANISRGYGLWNHHPWFGKSLAASGK
jgi:IclR family pca regulon transcriptional regulator